MIKKEETIIQVQISSDESEDDTSTPQPKQKPQHMCRLWRLLYWLTFFSFILGVISCISILTAPPLKKKAESVMGLEIWQWCVLITTILAGPVLMKAINKLVFITITAKKLVNNPIYYTVMLVDNIWVATYFCYVLLAWTLVNDPNFMGIGKNLPPQTKENILIKFDKANRIIRSTLITILMGTFLWFIKNLLLILLEENFRIKRFFERAKNSLMHEYWIKTLAGNEPKNGQNLEGVLSYDKYVKGSNKIKGEMKLCDLEKWSKDNVSRWMMKLIDMVIDERHIVYDVDGKEVFIKSKNDAKVAGDIIFNHLVLHAAHDNPCDMTITKEELKERLSKYFNEKQASNVMQTWLERVGDNHINREHFRKCTVKAWNNRNQLLCSLRSNKKIFQSFDLFVNVILVFIIIIVWLVMIKEEIRRAMLVVGSAIVGSAFIFADFSRKLLESLVFIFAAHPFDVGDYCHINDTPVRIHSIHPLSTVALTPEGNEKRYFPNSTLIGSTITNYSRGSPEVVDELVFYLDIATTQQEIDKLKSRIKSLLKKNRQYWFPKYKLEMEFILGDSTPVIQATLKFKHNLTYDEIEEKQDRKNKFFIEFKKILQEEKLLIKTHNN